MNLSKKKRKLLEEKYDGLCTYCGCGLPDRWHADHLLPVARGFDGKMTYPWRDLWDNLVPSCPSCNNMKFDLNPLGFRRVIERHIGQLNERITPYKFAKRYGLVIEVDKKVLFHFEKQQGFVETNISMLRRDLALVDVARSSDIFGEEDANRRKKFIMREISWWESRGCKEKINLPTQACLFDDLL